MSLLPLETVDTLRSIVSTMIQIYGIPCTLFIPQPGPLKQQETLDIYQEKPDYKDLPGIETKVWIEWKPDTKRLRKLGIFVEDNLPILAWFEGIHEITRNSWFRIPINIAQNKNTQDELEIIDNVVKNMYSSIIVSAWIVAPRRKGGAV